MNWFRLFGRDAGRHNIVGSCNIEFHAFGQLNARTALAALNDFTNDTFVAIFVISNDCPLLVFHAGRKHQNLRANRFAAFVRSAARFGARRFRANRFAAGGFGARFFSIANCYWADHDFEAERGIPFGAHIGFDCFQAPSFFRSDGL